MTPTPPDAATAMADLQFQFLGCPDHRADRETLRDCTREQFVAWANDIRDGASYRSDADARIANVLVRGINQLNAAITAPPAADAAPLRTLLDEAVDELNRAKHEITSPAEDRLIAVCDLLIQWLQEKDMR